MGAKVVLVPTPIGNLDDITLRAIHVLKAAHRIAAEDTRHSGMLLKHLGIAKPLTALHQHNEHARVAQLLQELLASGETLAVISDAGTPAISDPGFLIVREALRLGIAVEALPGPTALIPALAASGLPTNRFVFEGFLPTKKGRQTRLQQLAAEPRTLVLYESPHKLLRTLQELSATLGATRACAVARELSKLHEEFFRGTLAEAAVYFGKGTIRGELVIVVAGADYDPSTPPQAADA